MVFCPIAGSSVPTFCSRCSRCCQMAWRQADTPRPHPGSQLTSLSCDHLDSPLREVSGRFCSYKRTPMQTHDATSDLYRVVGRDGTSTRYNRPVSCCEPQCRTQTLNVAGCGMQKATQSKHSVT